MDDEFDLINLAGHFAYAVGCTDGIEMDAGDTVEHQFAALLSAPLNAYLAHLFVRRTFLYFVGQFLGDVNFECLGQDAEL